MSFNQANADLHNIALNIQKTIQDSGRDYTWYNLTGADVKLPDGTILQSKGRAESIPTMTPGINIGGIPSVSFSDYDLTLDGIPFPEYRHNVRYMVDCEIIRNHPGRQDIFYPYLDENRVVVRFLTTNSGVAVARKVSDRHEKSSRRSH